MPAVTTRYTQTSAVVGGAFTLEHTLLKAVATVAAIAAEFSIQPSTCKPTTTATFGFSTYLTVDNYDDAEATFLISMYGDKPLYGNTGVVWGLDNIGTSAPDGALGTVTTTDDSQFVKQLSGTTIVIPLAEHNKGLYPSVTVVNISGQVVSTVITYTAGNITIDSSESLINHSVIIRN